MEPRTERLLLILADISGLAKGVRLDRLTAEIRQLQRSAERDYAETVVEMGAGYAPSKRRLSTAIG